MRPTGAQASQAPAWAAGARAGVFMQTALLEPEIEAFGLVRSVLARYSTGPSAR